MWAKMLLHVHACVVQARKIADLGRVNMEDVATNRQERYYVPNWFSVEIKTGVSVVCLPSSKSLAIPITALFAAHVCTVSMNLYFRC